MLDAVKLIVGLITEVILDGLIKNTSSRNECFKEVSQ